MKFLRKLFRKKKRNINSKSIRINPNRSLEDIKSVILATLSPVEKSIRDLTNQIAEGNKRQDHLLGHIEVQNNSISKLQKEVYNLMSENVGLKQNNNSSGKSEQPLSKLEQIQPSLKNTSIIEKEIIKFLGKEKLTYDNLTKKLSNKISVNRVRGYCTELRKRGVPIISERYEKNKVKLFING